MKNYKTINRIAIIISIIGIGFQIYNDLYVEGDNDYGTLMVIAALFLSVVNQYFKDRDEKKEN